MPAGRGRRVRGQRWCGQFKGCGYRMTVPRQAIMDVLCGSGKHLSAEEIYMRVHKTYSNIGLATVYRTLELLTRMGLAVKFDFGDGRARYEPAGDNEKAHHHHLICTKCKRIIEYTEFIDEEMEFLERAEKGLSEKYDFDIKSHMIGFYGLCDKCKEEK